MIYTLLDYRPRIAGWNWAEKPDTDNSVTNYLWIYHKNIIRHIGLHGMTYINTEPLQCKGASVNTSPLFIVGLYSEAPVSSIPPPYSRPKYTQLRYIDPTINGGGIDNGTCMTVLQWSAHLTWSGHINWGSNMHKYIIIWFISYMR